MVAKQVTGLCASLFLTLAVAVHGARLPSPQSRDEIASGEPNTRRQLQVTDPWTNKVSSVGPSGLQVGNAALTALTADPAAQGSGVFNYVDWALATIPQQSSGSYALAGALQLLTLRMNQVVTSVLYPMTETLDADLLSAINDIAAAHSYMVNDYRQMKITLNVENFQTNYQVQTATLKQALVDGKVEALLRDGAASLLSYGPAGVPAALFAMAEHLAVLQERFYLGDTWYRYIIRKYAAQYYDLLSISGNIFVQYMSDFFDKARQNYDTSTFTLQLDSGNGTLNFVNSEGVTAVLLNVSKSDLSSLTTVNLTSNLLSNSTVYNYVVYELSFMGSFADAISSLDYLRGFGNQDDVISNCNGCTVGLEEALAGSLARGQNATLSSTASGSSASLALDGNIGAPNGLTTPATCAHSYLTGTSQPFWRVALNGSQTVTSVHIFNQWDCCQEQMNGVEVWVGNQEDAYSDQNTLCTFLAFPFWSLGGPANRRVMSFACNSVGQYVWVRLPGTNRTLSLCEVVVLGEAQAPASYPPPSSVSGGPATTCLATASAAGSCGNEFNLCCPDLSPCCGKDGVCGNSTAACGTGCQELYSFSTLCAFAK